MWMQLDHGCRLTNRKWTFDSCGDGVGLLLTGRQEDQVTSPEDRPEPLSDAMKGYVLRRTEETCIVCACFWGEGLESR